MTISESIIQWLKRFESEGLGKIKTIETDALEATHASYGLIKAPQEHVVNYISGLSIHTDFYQFNARLSRAINKERIDNQAWFEALIDWIAEMNNKQDFPDMKEGCDCEKITVTTPFYVGMANAETAVYQMTISIKYRKEKHNVRNERNT